MMTDEEIERIATAVAERIQQPATHTVAEVAKILKLSTRSVRRLIDAGILKRIPGTHKPIISNHALNQYLTHGH
jgi:Mn-dependent DtxR family transcriptional regulator